MSIAPVIRTIILSSFLSLSVLTIPVANAQKSSKIKAQTAIVQVEGAAVYQFANFDAPVLEYLRAGTKVLASLKTKTGIGGFGAFFRVKLPSGKLGWIADVDLLPQYKVNPRSKSKAEVNPDYEKVQEQVKNANREPIYFEKYVGGGLGLVQFKEKFENKELSSDSLVFGFRALGPDLLFSAPPMDFSFMFSIEAPEHYKEIANGPAAGFFLITDLLLPFPVFETDSTMLTLGLGPMLTYTRFQMTVNSSPIDSEELRAGVVASLGLTHRINKFAIKFDGKYYYEKTSYYGAGLSILFFTK